MLNDGGNFIILQSYSFSGQELVLLVALKIKSFWQECSGKGAQ
jgi:hypothetical protein